MQMIRGNTYPVRVELKMLGGTWNPDARAWSVPDEKAETAKLLVARMGMKTFHRRRYARN